MKQQLFTVWLLSKDCYPCELTRPVSMGKALLWQARIGDNNPGAVVQIRQGMEIVSSI